LKKRTAGGTESGQITRRTGNHAVKSRESPKSNKSAFRENKTKIKKLSNKVECEKCRNTEKLGQGRDQLIVSILKCSLTTISEKRQGTGKDVHPIPPPPVLGVVDIVIFRGKLSAQRGTKQVTGGRNGGKCSLLGGR